MSLASTGQVVASEAIDICPLSLSFRRHYWRAHADESDASVLWPGVRRLLGQRLSGETTIVTAAKTRSRPALVVSRCVFNRSQSTPDLWYYGYLSTLPEYRRRGLGERVMLRGFEEIRQAGARYCSCYVEYGNRASVDLAEKLGLVRFPIVRLVVRGRVRRKFDSVRLAQVGAETVGEFISEQEATGSEGQWDHAGGAVLADEFRVPRPFLPWRAPDSALFRLELNEKTAGMARIGAGKSVLMPGTQDGKEDKAALLDTMVAALSDRERPVFVFASAEVCREYVARYDGRSGVSCRTFDIFWGAINELNAEEMAE